MQKTCLSITLSLVAAAAFAHHSPAMFDTSQRLLLAGTVREFQWTNPHSYIQLLVKEANGEEVEWSLEMAAPTYLANNGWRPSTLKAGQQVQVTMSPLANGSKGGLVWDVTTSDGRKLGGNTKGGT
jgi:hypothetical protein